MTTTTDLSPERLDELAQWIEQPGHHPTRAESRALIAMARAKQAVEQKRDELRALVVEWAADRLLPDGYCSECGETGPMINEMGHSGLCFVERALRILAQPTDAGGE